MSRPESADLRGWRFETFEERLALSAQPVLDCWFDPPVEPMVDSSPAFVEPLALASNVVSNVARSVASGEPAAPSQQFGFRGGQQTVAIIDSGIAYDHVALGGGFGGANRVVGGWDFAENDANPYDDGPAGFHGTHVAGIIGASDRRSPGLAPDVDLVALRVFDDQGGGHFAWVEQALQWVHQQRFAFEHPITTVNLSLGAEWNTNSLPSWATLDDELKQLHDDGIFVAVAAGNTFSTLNAAGLSYPAVSEYVVPVASVDASGNLSRFSQRDARVLAAPGEKIRSTLPDAFFGSDGNKNDWGPSSGTSMASPYVAGASVLVREAMTKLGVARITPAAISDLLRQTADTVYDPVTAASYQRINLERALATLGGSVQPPAAPATDLGVIEQERVEGLTVTGNDRWFQITAGRTGRFTAEALFASAAGNVDLEIYDARSRLLGASRGAASAERIDFEAAAGQRYLVRLVGKHADVDLRLTNLVTIAGNQVTATGTAESDTIRWQAGTQQQLVINGVSYRLAAGSQVAIDAGGGQDALTVVGAAAAESITLRPAGGELSGSGYRVRAAQAEQVQFVGQFTDSASVEQTGPTYAVSQVPRGWRLSGHGFSGVVEGPGKIGVVAPPARPRTSQFGELAFSMYGTPSELRRARMPAARSGDEAMRQAAFDQFGAE